MGDVRQQLADFRIWQVANNGDGGVERLNVDVGSEGGERLLQSRGDWSAFYMSNIVSRQAAQVALSTVKIGNPEKANQCR